MFYKGPTHMTAFRALDDSLQGVGGSYTQGSPDTELILFFVGIDNQLYLQ